MKALDIVIIPCSIVTMSILRYLVKGIRVFEFAHISRPCYLDLGYSIYFLSGTINKHKQHKIVFSLTDGPTTY